MKTKNIITILATLPLLAGLTACSSTEVTEAKPANETLIVVGGNVIEYKANEEGPANGISIQADCGWTVNVDRGTFNDAITVSPRRGTGNGMLVITSDQNTDPHLVREAVITLVSDGGLKQRVLVRQKGGDDALNISKSSFNFDAVSTESQLLTITSNTTWNIQIPTGVNWLHLDKTTNSVTGAETVELKVDNAVTDAARSATLAITYGTKSAHVEVTQGGISNINLAVQPTSNIRFGSSPEGSVISVESNAEWHAFIPSSASWLRFEDSRSTDGHSMTGVGNGEVRIVCEENMTTLERVTAVVVIAGTKNPEQRVVIVEQAGNGSVQPLETSIALGALSVTRQSATFLLNVVSQEVVGEYGIVYSTSNDNPMIGTAETLQLGRGGTSFGIDYELTGLQDGTTYYVRAYVQKPSTGEVLYSNLLTITTAVSELTIGQLTSLSVFNTYAEFHFSFVSDEEVMAYGLVYSPTVAEPTVDNGTVLTLGNSGTTRNVMGVIEGLQETTEYRVRAYVLSSKGYQYSPNVVTITTSSSAHEPGESDNPDPQLSRRFR